MLFWFLACHEYSLEEMKQNQEEGEEIIDGRVYPLIEVTPTEIDFGFQNTYAPTAAQIFTIRNIGTAPLSVYDLFLEGDIETFALTTVSNLQIQPSESQDFVVNMFTQNTGLFDGIVSIVSNDPFEDVVEVTLAGEVGWSQIQVTPSEYGFTGIDIGQSDQVTVQITNVGNTDVTIQEIDFLHSSSELQLLDAASLQTSLPFVLSPNQSKDLFVEYTPIDNNDDNSSITVYSELGENIANQYGQAKYFEGFSSGWYVYDDGIPYETVSNSNHTVDSHGDHDLYWYEPSGAHGLVDSIDPTGDFAIMRQYVLDRAGPPVQVNGPFNFQANSTLSTFEYATFTYFMCDFYLDPTIDVSRYAISGGSVDDGMQIMLNGQILGHRMLGEGSFSWPLQNAHPGQMNTLIMILVDDSAFDKYAYDLAFTLDGQMVE